MAQQEWKVGVLARDGKHVWTDDVRYAAREEAEGVAADRRRAKPFMSFVVIPAQGPWQ